MALELSRRAFAKAIGSSMTAAGLRGTLGAMGLLPTPTAYASPPQLAADAGFGRTVLILGAGIAGMVAGYQLNKAGFRCTILEARNRAGGRVWTLRGGDSIVEKQSTQDVRWDRKRHLYLNAGAARISQHHKGILQYCREFDIPLETFVSDNRAALLHTDNAFGGEPQLLSRVISDGRGALAELAAKAAPTGIEGLHKFIRAFGQLQPDMSYTGSGRAGYKTPPGGGLQAGEFYSPLALKEIAQAVKDPADPKYRNPLIAMIFSETWDQAPTMLQPIGGMDAITNAFAHALGDMIKYQSQVLRIERSDDTARVVWRDAGGAHHATEAEIVICTLPLPVLAAIPADFSPKISAAINRGASYYVPAAKVGFISERRWWELDHQLYGGASWTSREITQVWYPSHGFHEKDGILVGGYIWDDTGRAFAAKSPPERLQSAMAAGERLHPGYASLVERGVSVAWPNVPFSEGGWCEWPERQTSYVDLISGEGPFCFAGEHMSYVPGWQEGAVQSAHYTVEQIKKKVQTPH